jgi:hypothetical protein
MLNSTWLEDPKNKFKLITLAFTVLLFPFICLSFFVFPTTDDYCHALSVIDMGYFGYQEHYWKTWSGRYIGTLISATQPLSYNSYLGYKLVPIFLLVLYTHAIIKFIKALTFDKLASWETGLLSLLVLFTLIAQLPTVSGYFYWYTGYYYTIADIGTLYLFAYFFRKFPLLEHKHLVTICVSIFLLVGTNEYTLVWLVALSGAWFFFNSLIHKKIRFKELIIFLVAFVFGVISITAPGNGLRAESGLYPTPLKYDLLFSLKSSLSWGLHNLLNMAPLLTVLSLVLISFAARLYREQNGEFTFLRVNPIISVTVFFLCLYVSYFPSYWSIAEPPNLRGQCVITFWTLLGWTFNTFVITFWVMRKYEAYVATRFGMLGWVIGLFFLITYGNNFNYRSAWSDLLTGRAARYHSEMVGRTKLVLESASHSVVIPVLKNTPHTILMVNDKTDSPWASVEVDNGCAEWFFKRKFFYK